MRLTNTLSTSRTHTLLIPYTEVESVTYTLDRPCLLFTGTADVWVCGFFFSGGEGGEGSPPVSLVSDAVTDRHAIGGSGRDGRVAVVRRSATMVC